MSEWKEYLIDELKANKKSSISIGPFGSRMKSNCYQSSGIPVIRGNNISDMPQFTKDFVYISEEKSNELESSKVYENDLVFPHRGNIGEVGIVTSGKYKTYILSSSLMKLTCDTKLVYPKFLYHFFKSRIGRRKLLQNSSQVGTPGISTPLTSLKEISITLPPIEEQKAIAAVLSCLDGKIENLRRQNETLEAIAQTLFKHWFIDFEFPNPDGKPYKSSGGAMEPSELGEIPAGWQVGTIDDVVSLIIDYRGKTPKKLDSDWSLSGIPALSAKNIKNGKIVREDSINYVDEELYKKWMKDELQKHDVLLTSEAPLGEVYYLASNEKYVLSQRLFALRVKTKFSASYLYQWLISFQGQYLLNRRATGSTVQGIRQVELRQVEIIIPTFEVLEKASKLWSSSLEKMNLNSQQIKTLTKTRDTLLPKLMSGQLRVKDL